VKVRLFVYGTLAPGEESWARLEPHVSESTPATAAGRLYDTGRGYPGAVFGAGPGVVHGWICEIDDRVLGALDAFEGDEYERITVRCDDGSDALAYHWVAPLDGCTCIESGNWFAHR
jgi:gamma-glutamylcyclotransferase (GGCT)/AIG2-like uncharacterized protein YtfP